MQKMHFRKKNGSLLTRARLHRFRTGHRALLDLASPTMSVNA